MTNAERFVERAEKEYGMNDAAAIGHFLFAHPCWGFKCETMYCEQCKRRDFWKREVEDGPVNAESTH